jgi:type II restriction/modification system DNA methylase subunit YeeA
MPGNLLIAFAREDDYFFGVLHSRAHEVWSLRMGTWLGKGNDPRYTPTTTFETFPLPWPPGQEPQDDPRVEAIADAARELDRLREAWLNPPDASEADLKKRTLTNLYNARPTWLANAHAALDRAVWAAYGWPGDEVPAEVAEDVILSRLLALNQQRAAGDRQ